MSGFVVLVTKSGSESALSAMAEGLKKRLPDRVEVRIPPARDEESICASVRDVDVIIGSYVSRRVIQSAPKLRLIQTTGTGVSKVDIDAATERGVTVCSSVGGNAVPVSEHALALILALAKKLPKYQKDFDSGRWEKTNPILLEGKTLGIIGLGSVGVEVAKRVRPFGLKILALKRHPVEEELKKKLDLAFAGGPESLDYVLSESDFVLLSVVLTNQTRGLMGESQFARMKEGAFLVNVSRGEVVDEAALIRALQSGRLAGAGLDVLQIEPPKPDNPLYKLDNVIITPHVGGVFWLSEDISKRIDFLAQNIIKALSGVPPDNVVDPVLKYSRRTTPIEL